MGEVGGGTPEGGMEEEGGGTLVCKSRASCFMRAVSVASLSAASRSFAMRVERAASCRPTAQQQRSS